MVNRCGVFYGLFYGSRADGSRWQQDLGSALSLPPGVRFQRRRKLRVASASGPLKRKCHLQLDHGCFLSALPRKPWGAWGETPERPHMVGRSDFLPLNIWG